MFSKIAFKGLSKNKEFGYAAKLNFFKKNKKIEFKPGLNIIYAPNGTGKSTILSMMALSMACKQSGESVVTGKWNSIFGFENLDGIEVFHDGQPAMYCNPREAVGLIGGSAAFDDDFMSEGIAELRLSESTGKTTLYRMGKIVNILMGKDKIADEIKFKKISPEYIKEDRAKLLEARIPVGQKSILLDEPESGLAVPVQQRLFALLDKAAKEQDLQIIVATHSVFALGCDANFIELEPEYVVSAKASVMYLLSAILVK